MIFWLGLALVVRDSLKYQSRQQRRPGAERRICLSPGPELHECGLRDMGPAEPSLQSNDLPLASHEAGQSVLMPTSSCSPQKSRVQVILLRLISPSRTTQPFESSACQLQEADASGETKTSVRRMALTDVRRHASGVDTNNMKAGDQSMHVKPCGAGAA